MRYVAAVLTVFTVLAVRSANAAPILDQSCCPNANGRADFGTLTRVQTFTAGIDGLLTGIDLGLAEFTPGSLPTFELYLGAFAVGTDPATFGTPLTTLSLSNTGVPVPASAFGGTFYSSDISAISTVPGQQFSIVQRPGSGGGGWINLGSPAYAGGAFLTTLDGSSVLTQIGTDAIFRTFVEPRASVPEPASILLLGTAAVWAARRRLRTRVR